MANDYLFIFGTHPVVSLNELLGWAEGRALPVDVQAFEHGVALASINGRDDVAERLIHDLGGTVKIGEVIHRSLSSQTLGKENFIDTLSELIKRCASASSYSFGLSFYGYPNLIPTPKEQEHLALEVKRRLRQRASHVRWVSGKGKALSSVQVVKNKLDGEGVELLIWVTRDKVVIARTVAVQLFEDWGERDFGRPRRNAKQGMLPPKVARLMVNLLGLTPAGSLLDLFCGSGTVLMEAALLGWSRLIASDVNPQAVKDTKKNLDWLQQRPAAASFSLQTFVGRAEDLLSHLHPASVSAVVTEPSLGPPLTRRPSRAEVDIISQELLPLYRATLDMVGTVLELGGRAVVALPVWRLARGEDQSLPLRAEELPASLRFHVFPGPPPKIMELLRYHRPDQYVGREFIVLEKIATATPTRLAGR